MLKGKQIAVIGLVIVLMGLLFSLDIKGLVKQEGQQTAGMAEEAPGQASLSLESVSEAAKQTLNADMSQQISALEEQLKSADAQKKTELQRQIAQKWDDLNIPGPGAFYYEAIAESTNKYEDWLKAGNLFTNAYQVTQDTTIQPVLVQKAIHSFKEALELNAESLDAKTGLGVAYVNGSPNPMEGIQLLREVVEKDPENTNANMNLGLLSMKSGQFQKAVDRFRVVTTKENKPDAWLYLAMAYENLGDTQNAISAYTKGRELAADPSIDKLVEQKLQELKK